MPLTAKGTEIKSALTKEYSEEKGEQVLYAGKNKGTFKGIDCAKLDRIADGVASLAARFDAMVDASQYKTQEEEDRVRAERRKKALEEAEKPKDVKPGMAKASGSKRPFMIE